MRKGFADPRVADIFAAWPDELRGRLLFLRGLIFDVARTTPGTGQLVETIRWRVPAYLTVSPKSGTSVRLEGNGETGICGLYVPCSTSLVEQCRDLYGNLFRYEKNRGLLFAPEMPVPCAELRHFIAMALTYHRK